MIEEAGTAGHVTTSDGVRLHYVGGRVSLVPWTSQVWSMSISPGPGGRFSRSTTGATTICSSRVQRSLIVS